MFNKGIHGNLATTAHVNSSIKILKYVYSCRCGHLATQKKESEQVDSFAALTKTRKVCLVLSHNLCFTMIKTMWTVEVGFFHQQDLQLALLLQQCPRPQ